MIPENKRIISTSWLSRFGINLCCCLPFFHKSRIKNNNNSSPQQQFEVRVELVEDQTINQASKYEDAPPSQNPFIFEPAKIEVKADLNLSIPKQPKAKHSSKNEELDYNQLRKKPRSSTANQPKLPKIIQKTSKTLKKKIIIPKLEPTSLEGASRSEDISYTLLSFTNSDSKNTSQLWKKSPESPNKSPHGRFEILNSPREIPETIYF